MSQPAKINQVLAVQEQYSEQLLTQANVIGIGTGYRVKAGKSTDEICIQVLVNKKLPPNQLASQDLVPPVLLDQVGKKFKTDVLEIGIIDAYQDRGRYRPVPGGCSIGPETSNSAGTLGGYACDNTDDTLVLLTNNHVISNLDTEPTLRRIVQPGRLDGGVLPGDAIGQLKRDVTVNTVPNVSGATPPVSVVDAAIGTIEVERTDTIRQLGVPAIYEIQAPALGMNVQKRGRTTFLTTNGRITTINLTTLITYRNRTRLGRIQNSFIITSTDGNGFSAAGDSGSLILNQAEGRLRGTFPVVGLLFAGGTDASGTPITIANDINSVLSALNLTTVCTCVARAIIRAIFGGERLESRDLSSFLYHKERQVRSFRSQLEGAGFFGKSMTRVIEKETARVGHVLVNDDEAFGLLVRALRPLAKHSTNYDLMRAKIDDEIFDNLVKFGARVAKQSPKLKAQVALAKTVLSAFKGMTVGQILRSAKFSLDAPIKNAPRKGK